jgi:hypothetical protein
MENSYEMREIVIKSVHKQGGNFFEIERINAIWLQIIFACVFGRFLDYQMHEFSSKEWSD